MHARVPTANLTRADIRLLLTTARARPESYLVCRLLYFGGLRGGDVRNLLPADLMPAHRTLFLRAGKGDKDRYVLLDPETSELLSQRTISFDGSEEWLRLLVNGVAKKCGLYDSYGAQGLRVSPHSLRHAFATHRYEAGMNFALISHLLGHTLAEDTVTYTRAAQRQMRANYDRAHPLARPNRFEFEPEDDAPEPISHPSDTERQLEFLQQPAAARPGGLPAIPGPKEIGALLQQAAAHPEYHLLFRTLYASGAWLKQVLPLQPEQIDGERPQLNLPEGRLRLDPETWRMLRSAPALWKPKRQPALDFFLKCARATGLAQRYLAIRRPIGIDALRYAFGAHCAARNIDVLSLMTLMGHQYYETTESYLHSAAYRFLEQYDATTDAEVEP
jgi:integrase